jgi:hypothetical protein
VEALSFFAPIAFVFSLSAISQIGTLKKQVEKLQAEVEALKQQH